MLNTGENMNGTTDDITLISLFSLGEGFAINTNLLDTNLINLTVVIGVLIYFGKGILTTLLTNRKENIVSTIRDAEQRYAEAVDKLNQATIRVEEAKSKANEIRQSGRSQIEKEREQLIKAAELDSKRFDDFKNDTIRFEEQKIVAQIKQKVSKLALEKAFEILKTRLNIDLQNRMIDYHINILTEMKTSID
jgi:F-type H+-transporting ATPase subunit b